MVKISRNLILLFLNKNIFPDLIWIMNLFQNALISFKWCVSINYYFSRFRDICTCLVCISNRVHLSNSYRASSISCNPVQKARLIPVQEPIHPKYSLLIPLPGRGVMLCLLSSLLFFSPSIYPVALSLFPRFISRWRIWKMRRRFAL